MAFTHLPVSRCVVGGLAAAVVGYVGTLVVTAGVSVGAIRVTTNGEPARVSSLIAMPEETVTAGWLFYNAQFVPTSLPVLDPEFGVILVGRNLLLMTGGVSLLAFLLVPTVLLAAGYAVAATGAPTGANGSRNAGAAIALGYGPVVLLGAFLLTAPAVESNAVASPDGLRTLLAGVVFPLLFGGLGGSLAD